MKLAKSLFFLPVLAALSISSCVNTVPSGNLYSTYGTHGYDPNSFGGHGGGYGGGYNIWPNCPDRYNGNYNDYYLCDGHSHVEYGQSSARSFTTIQQRSVEYTSAK